jgi:anti-sigma factor RsiW
MSTAPHPVAPEEIMAHLDGELSTEREQPVSTHIESCASCQELVNSLRSTAHSLSHWTVRTPATSFDEHVFRELAKHKGSGGARENSLRRLRMFWSRPLPWALASLALTVLFGAQILNRSTSSFHSSIDYPRERAVVNRDAVPASRETVDLRRAGPNAAPAASAVPNRQYEGIAGLKNADRPFSVAQNSLPIDSRLAGDKLQVFKQLKELQRGYQGGLQAGPMIARTVSLSFIAKDFDSSRASLDGILARHNGYAADLNVATPQGAARSLQASLRIPAPQLPAALAELKSLGRVELETQNGEEVTQEHADLAARLKNSRETEQRLQAILTQRTGKIGDVLEVEREIARVRGEIEHMEAEQKNLEHRVDFATIDLKLSEEYKARLDSPAPAISTLIHNAAVNGYRNVVDTVLAITLFFAEYGPVLIFWLLLFFIPAWLVWRRWRHAVAV